MHFFCKKKSIFPFQMPFIRLRGTDLTPVPRSFNPNYLTTNLRQQVPLSPKLILKVYTPGMFGACSDTPRYVSTTVPKASMTMICASPIPSAAKPRLTICPLSTGFGKTLN